MLYSLMVRPRKRPADLAATFAVFQNDPATYDEGVDFMFGDSLLVANVVEKRPNRAPCLPAQDRERKPSASTTSTPAEYAPGQTIEVPVDISSIPLFVRNGAILPIGGNRPHQPDDRKDH